MYHKLYWLMRWRRDRCRVYRQTLPAINGYVTCISCKDCPYDYDWIIIEEEEDKHTELEDPFDCDCESCARRQRQIVDVR